MTVRQQNKLQAAAKNDKLPYFIELWDESSSQVEQVLAQASKISLARAIFKAALGEHPGRRVTLRYGSRIMSDDPQA